MSLEHFWNDQAEWSRATFGSDKVKGPLGALRHLLKEVQNECIPVAQSITLLDPVQPSAKALTIELQKEIVDCLFLVFDAARRSGLTCAELSHMAYEKLWVNKLRSWPKPTDNDMPVEHDRSLD